LEQFLFGKKKHKSKRIHNLVVIQRGSSKTKKNPFQKNENKTKQNNKTKIKPLQGNKKQTSKQYPLFFFVILFVLKILFALKPTNSIPKNLTNVS